MAQHAGLPARAARGGRGAARRAAPAGDAAGAAALRGQRARRPAGAAARAAVKRYLLHHRIPGGTRTAKAVRAGRRDTVARTVARVARPVSARCIDGAQASCGNVDRHPLPPRRRRVRRPTAMPSLRGRALRGCAKSCCRPSRSANFEAVRALAHRHGLVYALGIHPLAVDRAGRRRPGAAARRARGAPRRPRLVAIGEIGLDGFVPGLDPARLERFFAAQLKLARDFALPVILHVRRVGRRACSSCCAGSRCPAASPMRSTAASSRPRPSSSSASSSASAARSPSTGRCSIRRARHGRRARGDRAGDGRARHPAALALPHGGRARRRRDGAQRAGRAAAHRGRAGRAARRTPGAPRLAARQAPRPRMRALGAAAAHCWPRVASCGRADDARRSSACPRRRRRHARSSSSAAFPASRRCARSSTTAIRATSSGRSSPRSGTSTCDGAGRTPRGWRVLRARGSACGTSTRAAGARAASTARSRMPLPNDLAACCAAGARLAGVVHNGGESARAMRRTRALGVAMFRLPSTSPANASWSFERKLAAWRAAFERHGLA